MSKKATAKKSASRAAAGGITLYGDFGAAARRLVDLFFEPGYIRRKAKAQADAALIKANTNAEIARLAKQAETRHLAEAISQERNIEAIVGGSLPHLSDNSKPEKIDTDWKAHFLNRCRDVSEVDMQSLWSRILAGEANEPGSVSRRTLVALEQFDKVDADLFTDLCRFAVLIDQEEWGGVMIPIIFEWSDPIVQQAGLNWEGLSYLDTIGLIDMGQSSMGFDFIEPTDPQFQYFGKPVEIPFGKKVTAIGTGCCTFTRIGRQLQKFCQAEPLPGFESYLKQHVPEMLNYTVFLERRKAEAVISEVLRSQGDYKP